LRIVIVYGTFWSKSRQSLMIGFSAGVVGGLCCPETIFFSASQKPKSMHR